MHSRDDEVLKYLEDYASDVVPYIHLNTIVNRIRKVKGKPDCRWIVTSTNFNSKESTTEEYDAICDCTGHYTRPYIPYVRDLWKYKRPILHAKWYRKPDAFAGQVRCTQALCLELHTHPMFAERARRWQ